MTREQVREGRSLSPALQNVVLQGRVAAIIR